MGGRGGGGGGEGELGGERGFIGQYSAGMCEEREWVLGWYGYKVTVRLRSGRGVVVVLDDV